MECVKCVCIWFGVGGERIGFELYQSCGNRGVWDVCLLNAAQYRRNKDWTYDPCSASKTQQPTPPQPSPSPSPAPSADQISDDSTFNVLHFNANGICNKVTELGVVLERNKVKVAVIQESKLSSKSKN